MTYNLLKLLNGAQDWIRTSTSLRTLRPEHSASTNFATWAFRSAKVMGKIEIQKYIQKEIFFLLNL